MKMNLSFVLAMFFLGAAAGGLVQKFVDRPALAPVVASPCSVNSAPVVMVDSEGRRGKQVTDAIVACGPEGVSIFLKPETLQ